MLAISYLARSDLLGLRHIIMEVVMETLGLMIGIDTLNLMDGSAVLIKTVPGLTEISDVMTENLY